MKKRRSRQRAKRRARSKKKEQCKKKEQSKIERSKGKIRAYNTKVYYRKIEKSKE